MSKPQNYDENCVIVRNIPYQLEDELYEGPMPGGVLGKGREVWVRDFTATKKRPVSVNSVSAYVEGIGMVTVDPRCLVRAS
jgi:hypothetical protein